MSAKKNWIEVDLKKLMMQNSQHIVQSHGHHSRPYVSNYRVARCMGITSSCLMNWKKQGRMPYDAYRLMMLFYQWAASKERNRDRNLFLEWRDYMIKVDNKLTNGTRRDECLLNNSQRLTFIKYYTPKKEQQDVNVQRYTGTTCLNQAPNQQIPRQGGGL